MMIEQDYGVLGVDKQTQMLIAPVLVEMKADRAFEIGDQFIVNSVLYKATSAIAINDSLVVGTNCAVSDTITQQIKPVILEKSGNTVTLATADTWYNTDAMIQIPTTGKYLMIAIGSVQPASGGSDSGLYMGITATNSTHTQTPNPFKATVFSNLQRAQASFVMIHDCSAGEYYCVCGECSTANGRLISPIIQAYKIG